MVTKHMVVWVARCIISRFGLSRHPFFKPETQTSKKGGRQKFAQAVPGVGLPGPWDQGREGGNTGGQLLGAAPVLEGSGVAMGWPAETGDLAGSVAPGKWAGMGSGMDKFWRCQQPRWDSPLSLGVLLLDLHPTNLQPCSTLNNKPQ